MTLQIEATSPNSTPKNSTPKNSTAPAVNANPSADEDANGPRLDRPTRAAFTSAFAGAVSTAQLSELKQLGKQDETGKYLVSDAQVSALKSSIREALNFPDNSTVSIAVNAEGSAINKKDNLLTMKGMVSTEGTPHPVSWIYSMGSGQLVLDITQETRRDDVPKELASIEKNGFPSLSLEETKLRGKLAGQELQIEATSTNGLTAIVLENKAEIVKAFANPALSEVESDAAQLAARSAYIGTKDSMEWVKLSHHSSDRGGGFSYVGTTATGEKFLLQQSTISAGGKLTINGIPADHAR